MVAYGANLPSDETGLSSTVDRIIHEVVQLANVTLRQQSRRFRTPAWPPGSGPDFINGVLALDTDLAPEELLEKLHGIEAKLGRERRKRWEARVCDLDLIAFGGKVSPDAHTVSHWMELDDAQVRQRVPEALILPHPRMHLRAFVLVPFCEILPDWQHPILGRTAAELLSSVAPEDRAKVVPVT